MPTTKRRTRKPKIDFLKASQNLAQHRELQAARLPSPVRKG